MGGFSCTYFFGRLLDAFSRLVLSWAFCPGRFQALHFAPGHLPQPLLPRSIYPAGFYPGGFNPTKNEKMKPTHYVITPAGHVLASFASASGAWAYAQEMNATLPPDHDEKERAWAAWARCPYVPTRFFVTTEKDF